jgi:diacylglycerol kinase family enzyme
MARKIRARPMLQQLAAGTSRNAISRSLGVPEHSIQAVAEAAEREKVSWCVLSLK